MIITNARIVTPDAVVHGTVSVEGGMIHAVEEGPSGRPGAFDLEGDFLLPGLIEMHTDNMEKHLQPRPGVHWPSATAAMVAHDTQVAGAGITTVLDAISVGDYRTGGSRRAYKAKTIDALRFGRAESLFKADHHLHLRCELCDDAVVEMFAPHADVPMLKLVSVMDHTPGQRQWRDMDKLYQFHSGRGMSDADFEVFVQESVARQGKNVDANRRTILDQCRARGLRLASHDDTTEDHVDEAVDDGISISEFPTTVEAARRARDRGLKIVMGSPNVVRGGSHSGNVAAIDLAREALVDGLSSDYVPISLLHAAFMLHDELDMGLADAVATVSLNVAEMLDFNDRGAIVPDRRADLVRVRRIDGAPLVRTVWRQGRQII